MGIAEIFRSVTTWWNGATLNTLLWTRRFGTKVGEDDAGNVYYHNPETGRRWVIFNGEVEGSRVPPEWHGWLHYTWDEPPTERPVVRKAWEKPHLPNMTGTPLAYAPPGSIRREVPQERSDYEAWSPE